LRPFFSNEMPWTTCVVWCGVACSISIKPINQTSFNNNYNSSSVFLLRLNKEYSNP
jgi:hypothetical protein